MSKPEASEKTSDIGEVLKRVNFLRERIEIVNLTVKEAVGNPGRNPMDHPIRQQLLFELKVEEAKLRAEYFVQRDLYDALFAKESYK